MPKVIPEQPWPLSRAELESEATTDLAQLLQIHPDRSADLGNPLNLPKFILAYEFYREQGFPRDEIGSHLRGIDFNQAVETITMPPPRVLSQWQIPALGTETPRVGCYWMLPKASTPKSLGINPKGPRFDPNKGRPSSSVMMERTEFNFKCSDDTPPIAVLRTTAASIIDDWTDKSNPRRVYGGGQQHFSRELGDHYKQTFYYQLGRQWLHRSPLGVLKEEGQGNSASIGVDSSRIAMHTVLQKLQLAQITVLNFHKTSDRSDVLAKLTKLVQEAEKAASEAQKIAAELSIAIADQKYEAAQAVHYANIARKDLRELIHLFKDFEKTNEKAQDHFPSKRESFVNLQRRQKYTPLPPISSAYKKSTDETEPSFPSLDKKKRHAVLAPIQPENSIKTLHEFKTKIHEGRVQKDKKGPPHHTDSHKRN